MITVTQTYTVDGEVVHRDVLSRHRAGQASDLNGPQQLDKAAALALAAGLRRAADMIGQDRQRRYPIRDWEYGACVWCEVIDGKRRKATMLDIGGGPPTCDKHSDPDNFPDPPAKQWAHAEPSPREGSG